MGPPTVVEVVDVEASCRFLHVSATTETLRRLCVACGSMCSPTQLHRFVALSDVVKVGALIYDLELHARAFE